MENLEAGHRKRKPLKKLAAGLLAIPLAFGSFAGLASQDIGIATAYAYVDPQSLFTFNSETGEIINYLGIETEVAIPSQIGETTVTVIGAGAFSEKNLTSVTIPNTVTKIDDGAFYKNKLTSIEIPDSVTLIGQYAFTDNQLESVVIPGSVKTIDEEAFSFNQLTSVTFSDGVDRIGPFSFINNSLKEIVIPSSVTSIERQAFFQNSLESVTVMNPDAYIESDAFIHNQETPSDLKIISYKYRTDGYPSYAYTVADSNQYTFEEIASNDNDDNQGGDDQSVAFVFDAESGTITGYTGTETDIVIPETIGGTTVRAIGNEAFKKKGLTSVTIPDTVETIGDSAFYTNNLANVTIPNSVTSIGEHAFQSNKLESVVLSNSITSIGYWAFAMNPLSNVVIPESVTLIDDGAFYYNKITSITIPDSVTRIGRSAFLGNPLSSVVIPSSVTIIDPYAFFNNNLTSVEIPDSVEQIGDHAFASNSLSEVVIRGANTQIDDTAFDSNTTDPSLLTIKSYEYRNGEDFSYAKLLANKMGYTFIAINDNQGEDDGQGGSESDNQGSNGDQGGSDNSGSTNTTPAQPVTEQITVDVETGKLGEAVVNQTVITRTRDKGVVQDKVTLTPESTQAALRSILDAGKSLARVVIPDEKDEVSQIDFLLPAGSSKQIIESNVDLEIYTENVRIQIPASSLDGMEDDVYFRLVPIRDESERTEVEERARVEQAVVSITQGQDVQVIARPMTIETNLQSRPVTLILPLIDVEVPTVPAERDAFLAELAVFIEHTDGDKELVIPQVVEYKPGVYGLQISVNKFSTFTILKMEGSMQAESGHHASYINGFVDGTFKPEKSITRAEIAAILARNLGFEAEAAADSSFPDVSDSYWAAQEIEYVKSLGLMVGDDQGNFRPNAPITRGEMAAIAARYKELDTTGITASSFGDVEVGYWGTAAIEAAKAAGILDGYEDGTFKPFDQLTRAEAVKIVNRLFNRGPLHGLTQPSWPDVPTTHWAYEEIEEASQAHDYTNLPEGGENIR